MKTKIAELYEKLKDHPYWNEQSQENWNDARPLIIELESCIASYKFWNHRYEYNHKLEVYLYESMHSVHFTTYCHDVRKYMSYSKIFENKEYEQKRRDWLYQYLQFVECFINNKVPFVNCGRYKTTVRSFINPFGKELWYNVYIYKKCDRQYLIDVHKKWMTCKAEYTKKWAAHVVEQLENNTTVNYEFE